MRIVVTGRNGQAGALPWRGRVCAGRQVVAVGRPGFDLERPSGIDDALAAERPDIIVSAAAYTAVDKAEAEPEAAFAANRDGAGAVAAAAQRLGVPVIHLSTDYVFDGTKGEPYVGRTRHPLSVYGRSKLEGERLVGRRRGPCHPAHGLGLQHHGLATSSRR